MEKFLELFAGIDPKIVIICAIVLVVLALIALIKKAFKVGIIVLLLAIILGGGGLSLDKIASQFGIEFDGSNVELRLGGQEYSIDVNEIAGVEVEDGVNGKCSLTVNFEDGTSGSYEIPTYMKGVIKGVAGKAGVPYKVISYTGLD